MAGKKENETHSCLASCGCFGLFLLVLGGYGFFVAKDWGEGLFVMVVGWLVLAACNYIDEQGKANQEIDQHSGRGKVYLLKSQSYYKIGMTRGSVEERVRSLKTGNPSKIEIVHVIETNQPERVEAELHQQYAVKRVKGEWFKLTLLDVWSIKIK
ncbi:MAG: GIY-YIG nuclease family protein [Anaerolineae bacterium]|nr:GIY-YIG nuclease family protein [Anaerolineae bacterium]